MKIRITDPGFANYTGYLGNSYFVDGVCEDVSASEAERMASIVRVEEFETGANPSVTQRMVDLSNKNADEMGINSNPVLTKGGSLPTPPPIVVTAGAVIDPVKPGFDYSFTHDDLSKLADGEGIAGLRAFAETYGVNGKSIKGIIADLMAEKALHDKPAVEQALTAQTDADVVSTTVVETTDADGNVVTDLESKEEERPAPTEVPVDAVEAPVADATAEQE
jgi:hypothetical protein